MLSRLAFRRRRHAFGNPGAGRQASKRLKNRVKLGAYPAFEYKGLIFGYLGPPELIPPFPIYDLFELADLEMVPYKAPFACNWLQVLTRYRPYPHELLHSSISRAQFSEGFGEVGQMDFFERDMWLLGTNTRRVGDNVWFRVNELVLPNFTQAGWRLQLTEPTVVSTAARHSAGGWSQSTTNTRSLSPGRTLASAVIHLSGTRRKVLSLSNRWFLTAPTNRSKRPC